MSEINTLIDSVLGRYSLDTGARLRRYPFAYAADFCRNHYRELAGADLTDTERDAHKANDDVALGFLRDYATRTGQNLAVVIIATADAWLTETRDGLFGANRGAFLVASLRENWQSYMLPDPTENFDAWRAAAAEVLASFTSAAPSLPTA